MTALTRLLRPALLAFALAAPASVLASPQDDLLAALDAYRANDIPRLTRIAGEFGKDPLRIYPYYWLSLKALDQNNDDMVIHFLDQAPPSYQSDNIRREWLKKLGKRQDWSRFSAEWAKLSDDARDEESQCYADQLTIVQGRAPSNLGRLLDSRNLPEGCNSLIKTAAARGLLDQSWLWQRFRLLLSANNTTQARQLAQENNLAFDPVLINNPGRANLATRSGQEAALFSIESSARSNPQQAAATLTSLQASLGASAAGFGWGQLATLAAKKQQMDDALLWFAKADTAQLGADQWEWWARAALRTGQWHPLLDIIRAMPPAVSGKPAWQYWQGRALRNLKQDGEANTAFAKASQSSGFYGLLALEALGTTLSMPADKAGPGADDTRAAQNDPTLQRSLELYAMAQASHRTELRTAAQCEWRWAMRGRSDIQLLAASEIARDVGFYDMAIYSAERTKTQHDFSLRYLTPYREITQRFASQLNIDDAWVYGLIRQESRFIPVARSGVGAQGLMQLMPGTARMVASKIGISDAEANSVETNIQLGTWYLKYVLNSLYGNPVLATAAYNAGPRRAREWQASVPLEGAVYAETIPYNETRDYVQKVMANAAYYASVMGHDNLSLQGRMATVPARPTQ